MQQREVYIGFRDEVGDPSNPLPKQMLFQSMVGPFKSSLYTGGLGTGKTASICSEAGMQSAFVPNNLGLMGRKVLDAFKKTTLPDLLETLGDFVIHHNAQDHEITLANKSRIIYMALDDNKEAIQRIKSLNLGWFSFDQLEEIPDGTYRAAKGQLRRKGSNLVDFHASNPAGHDIVCYKRFKQNEVYARSMGNALVEAITWPRGVPLPRTQQEVIMHSDNPHLPPEYIVELFNNPPQWINRFVHCEWDDFAGLVYPEFDEGIHFIKPFKVPYWWKHYVIYDYGYRNPTAILFAAVDDEGTVYCYDGIYVTEKLIEYIAPAVKQMDKFYKAKDREWLADPSINKAERDGMSVADEWYDEHDIMWDNAKNDRRAGFSAVSRFLSIDENHKPRMYFFRVPGLEPLRDEILEYKWAELKYGHTYKDEPEEPVKKKDHFMDTLRYLCSQLEKADTPEKKSDIWDQAEIAERFFHKDKYKNRNAFQRL